MRRSHWKKLGRTNLLRPRLPVQPTGGETNCAGGIGTGGGGICTSASHTVGAVNEKPEISGEVTPPGGKTDGRPVFASRSSRKSVQESTANGRSEVNSMIGWRGTSGW